MVYFLLKQPIKLEVYGEHKLNIIISSNRLVLVFNNYETSLIYLSWTGIYLGVKFDGTKRTLLVTNIMFAVVLGAWSVFGFVLYLIKEFLE